MIAKLMNIIADAHAPREPYECSMVPLRNAILCPDCNVISTSIHGRCRACDSEGISLDVLLGRPRARRPVRATKSISNVAQMKVRAT